MPFGGTTPDQDMGKSYVFSESIQVKSDSNDEVVVQGIISTTNPDLGRDIVTEGALHQMADSINNSFTSGTPLPLGFEHTEILGGHPNLVPIGSFVKAWVEEGKLYAKATVNKSLSIFKEVKSALDRRDLHSFSIEYVPEQVEDTLLNGVPHRIINTLKSIIGAALTGRPMNNEAVINFAAKNLNFNLKPEVKDMETTNNPDTEKNDDVAAPVEPQPADPQTEPATEPTEEPSKILEVQTKTNSPNNRNISDAEFKEFEDYRKKKQQESEESQFKSMFEKYYKDFEQQTLSKVAPAMESGKFSQPSQIPAEVKAWQDAIDSGSSEKMFEAAGKLVSFYEGKGMQYGTVARSAGKLFFKDQAVKGMNGMELGESNAGRFNLDTVQVKAQIEHDTNRTTSGSDYYQSGPLLNDIYSPAMITHLNESHTMYALMRKEDASDFGSTYGFRFKYARTGATANYDEDSTDAPTAANISYKKAQIPMMLYRSVGQVAEYTIAAARGRGGIGDAFSLAVRDHTENLLNSINVDIFDSSSSSAGMTVGNQMLSLRYLADDSSTYTTLYGHDRTSGNFTTLQGNLTAKSGTPEPNKDDLRLMWATSVEKGANMQDLVFVTSFTQLRKLLGQMDDMQRINGEVPHAGFRGMPTFDGIPIHADKDCDDGFIYLVDLRHTFLGVLLPPTIDELAKNGDYRKFQIKTYFNMVCTAPNHNYLMTGFNTS